MFVFKFCLVAPFSYRVFMIDGWLNNYLLFLFICQEQCVVISFDKHTLCILHHKEFWERYIHRLPIYSYHEFSHGLFSILNINHPFKSTYYGDVLHRAASSHLQGPQFNPVLVFLAVQSFPHVQVGLFRFSSFLPPPQNMQWICGHGALQWIIVPSNMYSKLPGVPGVCCRYTLTMATKRPLCVDLLCCCPECRCWRINTVVELNSTEKQIKIYCLALHKSILQLQTLQCYRLNVISST